MDRAQFDVINECLQEVSSIQAKLSHGDVTDADLDTLHDLSTTLEAAVRSEQKRRRELALAELAAQAQELKMGYE